MKICLVAVALLMLVSCGREGPSPQASEGHDHSGHSHDSHSHSGDPMSTERFGTPGDPEGADRVIDVRALDRLKFDPEELEAEVGDTLTFQVVNAGKLDHEFVLGDEDYQVAHEEMAGEAMQHEGNGIFLQPGAEGEVTWTFTEPGIVFFACHVDEHSRAGMYGHIKVQ